MLQLVPLLAIQRDLLEIPRGIGRFRRYLEILKGGTDDVAYPPLIVFNPMSKPHVADCLDTLLALDAEGIATRTLVEAEERLEGNVPEARVGLAVADDVAGGWTDRLLMEAHGLIKVPQALNRRGWMVILLWAGDPMTATGVRRATLATVYRTLSGNRFGPARTLREVLEQECRIRAFAGPEPPGLDDEDREYSETVLESFLDSDDFPVLFACLYGDEAARKRGYTPLGLSRNAGLEVAASWARRREDSWRAILPKSPGRSSHNQKE